MKNASEIVKSLQNLPHFARLSEYGCINALLNALIPTYRRIIKYAYLKNGVLYLIFLTTLNKHDKENISTTIKLLLGSVMLKDKLLQCKNLQVSDIVCKTDFKPPSTRKITYSSIPHYKERSKGVAVVLKDPTLQKLADEIRSIIEANSAS
ncbi:MAG: hypothetical protein WCR69_07960 [Sulfuricurvum sp.]|jgi:hypothetical protein